MFPTLWSEFLRPWAQYAVSIFNFLLLLWLGLTVFLNARQRSWGTLLAGSGLLVGAVFFALHTVALDYSLDTLLERSLHWWLLLAAPCVALPFGWLILMLWYCGAWTAGGTQLRRRTRLPLWGCIWGLALLIRLSVLGAPSGRWTPFGLDEAHHIESFWAVRALIFAYPLFLVGCTGTSLLALLNASPLSSWRRAEAQRRARPLLLASSGAQFTVSLGVAWALLGLGLRGVLNPNYALMNLTGQVGGWIDSADLLLTVGIALSVLLFGKAIVSFEIFTGKILPRRGIWGQWRAVVSFAAFYALVIGGAWGLEWRPIYPLLLSSACVSGFLAIFAWRALAERDRELNRLRAFVSNGERLDSLTSGRDADLERALSGQLAALCEGVIGASRALLRPSPSLAPLFGAPRVFPSHLPFEARWNSLETQGETVRALHSEDGWSLILKLGDEREVGALLLGPRRDGAIYTLEEIELARATGAYLLDIGASSAIAARLGALQKQKLAEIATLDRSARRRLHDDILPLLHGALLGWNVPESDARELISQAHRDISDLLRELPSQSVAPPDALEALRLELGRELSGAFDHVSWQADDAAHESARSLSPSLSQTLFFAGREALRNASRHARGNDATRLISLSVRACVESPYPGENPRLVVRLEDDGIGSLSQPAQDSPNGGAGLGLHATLLAIAGGELAVARDETGTKVSVCVPVAMAGRE